MQSKPDPQDFRFAMDYRAINSYTASKRSLIPQIANLLQKIGAHKPKYFAKMDLTSGFYQAPLHENSRKYTAFSTHLGLFEFLRVSMGLLNSPFYFQNVLEKEVLADLLNKIVQLYMDDMITWAQTVDELCDNLEQILTALAAHGIIMNPNKCEFGMTMVEFVGHLIDSSGISFTKAKLDEVAVMALPVDKGGLKTFLGVIGYFRNHIITHGSRT